MLHNLPDRFSDISGASDSQKFRGAIQLMRRVAAAAKETVPNRNEQSQRGIAPVVRFTEMADEFISLLKRKVDEEIGYGRQFGGRPDRELLRARLPKQLEGMLFIGVYRIQYELACMCMPPGGAGPERIHRISEMFRASNDVSEELGEFLRAAGVAPAEYREAVGTLRDFFMSSSDNNEGIRADKARISAVFAEFMGSYADFRIAPMEEGPVK